MTTREVVDGRLCILRPSELPRGDAEVTSLGARGGHSRVRVRHKAPGMARLPTQAKGLGVPNSRALVGAPRGVCAHCSAARGSA